MHHKGVARGYRPALFRLIIGGRSVPSSGESGEFMRGLVAREFRLGSRGISDSPAGYGRNRWAASLCARARGSLAEI
jgi:hypothetical protein